MYIKFLKIIKAIMFVCIACLLLVFIRNTSIPSHFIKQELIQFSDQEENSIDIAFIGSSSTHAYYNNMLIWNEYGITSMTFTNPSLPFDFTISLIDSVIKMQDPEVFVIDLRSLLVDEYNMKYYGSYETTYEKSSYISALNLLSDPFIRWDAISNYSCLSDGLYLQYFDFLYNHEDFFNGVVTKITGKTDTSPYNFKGNNKLSFSIENLSDYSIVDGFICDDENYELSTETVERLCTLLDYCQTNEINVCFNFTPYVFEERVTSDDDIRREIGEIVIDYGFSFNDYKENYEDIGLDLSNDFEDIYHVNAIGATKYTTYAMDDILSQYDIQTDYSQELIDEWDAEYAEWEVYYAENVAKLYEEIELANNEETSLGENDE